MDTVKEIENAVRKLPDADLAEFRRWFAEFDSVIWDAEMERDAASGKLDAIAEEALQDYHTGCSREL